MTLEASENGLTKTGSEPQPLLFRSIIELQVASDAEQTEECVEASPQADLEATLRAAHEQGQREALATAQHELEERLRQEREGLNRLVRQFEDEKQRYFNEVEAEVVKLSLAIAERVLHREAEMDPMLLAAAARVALGQVADTSETVLRVASSDVSRWNETLRTSEKNVVIEADEQLPRGEAILKTRSGTVQLGLKAQLQEIERGFFELLGRRPAMAM